jgi:hypothetical protein
MRLAGLTIVACALLQLASCASSQKIYVINDTGQPLSGGISGEAKFRLSAETGTQAVSGFPDRRWWLIADGCTYHYQAIATDDPAWAEQAEAARASGAYDLLVRVSKNFTVRAYTYYRRANAMMSREFLAGGLPMKPLKDCAASG